MANGDIILLDNHKFSVKLIDSAQGTTTGPWVEVPPQYSIWAFHADFPGTDTVQIQVSNSAVSLVGATTAGAILSCQTTNYAAISLTGNTASTTTIALVPSCAYRWVRAIKTGNTNTCSVILEADSNQ
jgi:hypothetical protein